MTTLQAEIAFDASGHTGARRRWWRTPDQLVEEVELITGLLSSPADLVVNFAPTKHLFGHLFGDVLPRHRNIPVVQAHEAGIDRVPTSPVGAHVLLVCLPSTWAHLRRAHSAFA
ncbi:MAG: hypothetical protein JO100_18605 [Pseudonocardia sp.]|nr:hypothetical protein [Pseudonocardia sp.]